MYAITLRFLWILASFSVYTNSARHGSRTDTHDPDSVVFPGMSHYPDQPYRNRYYGQPSAKEHVADVDDTQIPLSFIQRINEVQNVSDLLLNFVSGADDDSDFEEEFIKNRFGGAGRSAAIIPKPARCIPSLQTVELKNENNSGLFYIPFCTRVERCGGCCSHSLLSCQPTETELLSFQVIATQYVGGQKLNYKGKEIVLIEQHKKCKCDCTMKKEDCTGLQEYKQQECRCICKNLDEKKKCEKMNTTKLWDPKTCRCQCRETQDCSTGLMFDNAKCECVHIPVRRRFAELPSNKERPFTDEERYDVEPLPVIPISKTKNTT